MDLSRMGKEYRTFLKNLKKHFDITNGIDFVDPLYLTLGKVKIDLMKFDDWLHQQHGDYETRGLSMSEAIEQAYGKKAQTFINDSL